MATWFAGRLQRGRTCLLRWVALLSAAAFNSAARPAAIQAQSGLSDSRQEDTSLHSYLYRAGSKLDCYFTIEEMPREDGLENWIESYRLNWGDDPASVEELLDHLAREVKGVHFQRCKDNPAVIHIIDSRLERVNGYVMDQRIDMSYNGLIKDMADLLEKKTGGAFHARKIFWTGGWPGVVLDRSTKVKLTARNTPVRRLLTDWIPLSHYGRILWLSESDRTADGKLDTDIMYLGGGDSDGPMLLPGPFGLREPIAGVDFCSSEPVVNGVIPFSAGEIAYYNNLPPDNEHPRADLVNLAVSFIDERLCAKHPLPVRWAMLYLGKRQAKDGIPVLLKHLDYQYTTCGVLEESYPAVRALTQIGKPAGEAALVELLTQDESPLRLKLLRRRGAIGPRRSSHSKAPPGPIERSQGRSGEATHRTRAGVLLRPRRLNAPGGSRMKSAYSTCSLPPKPACASAASSSRSRRPTRGDGGSGGLGGQTLNFAESAPTPAGAVVATFTDPDGNTDPTQYQATVNWGDGTPTQLAAVSFASGQFQVTAGHTYAEEGAYTAAVAVTDSDGASGSVQDTATVADAALSGFNAADFPVAAGALFTAPVAYFNDADPAGELSDYSAIVTWGDGSSSQGTVVLAPAGGPDTFEVDGTHAYAAAGPYAVSVAIQDVGGSSTNANLTITAANLPYVVNPGPQSDVVGDQVVLPIGAGDADGDVLTFGAAGLPSGLSIDPASGFITGTVAVGADDGSPYSVTVTASDGANSASQTFDWTVSHFAIPNPGDQTNAVGDSVYVPTGGSDADGDALTFSASDLPAGLSIDPSSGTITGTIGATADAGSPYTVTLTASDGTNTASQTFDWTVTHVFVVNPGPQENADGDSVILPINAGDNDGDNVTASATGLPPGLSMNSVGNIVGTISDTADVGSPYSVTVTATDGTYSDSQTFAWTVQHLVSPTPATRRTTTAPWSPCRSPRPTTWAKR